MKLNKLFIILFIALLFVSSIYCGKNWYEYLKIRKNRTFGLDNIKLINDSSNKTVLLRVIYPKRSASPAVHRNKNTPIGGTQFYTDLENGPVDKLYLRYYLKFADNLQFVKDGKLPGLYGGKIHSGGHIPDGTNVFSTRYMWKKM